MFLDQEVEVSLPLDFFVGKDQVHLFGRHCMTCEELMVRVTA